MKILNNKKYIQYEYFKKASKNKGSYKEWKRRVRVEIAGKTSNQLDDLILYYEEESIKLNFQSIDVVSFLGLCMQILLIPTSIIMTVTSMIYAAYASGITEFSEKENIDSSAFFDTLSDISQSLAMNLIQVTSKFAIIAFAFIALAILIDKILKNDISYKKLYYEKIIKILKKERKRKSNEVIMLFIHDEN